MNEYYSVALGIFADMAEICFPFAFTFGFGGLLVRSALRMLLGGEVRFK